MDSAFHRAGDVAQSVTHVRRSHTRRAMDQLKYLMLKPLTQHGSMGVMLRQIGHGAHAFSGVVRRRLPRAAEPLHSRVGM
jgi:hypothetical protein